MAGDLNPDFRTVSTLAPDYTNLENIGFRHRKGDSMTTVFQIILYPDTALMPEDLGCRVFR